jgi:DNA primase
MNRPAGIAKSTTLFGVQTLQDNEPVVIVESPLDVAHIRSTGWTTPVVAVCGSSISDDQVKLLRSSSTIIAAFDNPNIDKAGKKACDDLQVLARKYGLMVYYFNYGDSTAKDPGDLNAQEISWGIEHAKSGIYGESAYVYRDTETIPG